MSSKPNYSSGSFGGFGGGAGSGSGGNTTPLGLGGQLVLKVRLGEDVRRIAHINEDLTYDDLLLMLQRIFSSRLAPGDELAIKYTDDGAMWQWWLAGWVARSVRCRARGLAAVAWLLLLVAWRAVVAQELRDTVSRRQWLQCSSDWAGLESREGEELV